MVTFENGCLYFYCKKLHTRFTAYCKDIKDFIKMNSFNHCEKLQADPFMCLIAGGTGSGKPFIFPDVDNSRYSRL